MNTNRVNLTRRELIEVVRALDLIMFEDASADCNMDAQSVRAKRSALRKLQDALYGRAAKVAP
jgi:hypothetical protein